MALSRTVFDIFAEFPETCRIGCSRYWMPPIGSYEHITPLLRGLHWLRVLEHIQFRLCVLAYRCVYGTAPVYLNWGDSATSATLSMKSVNLTSSMQTPTRETTHSRIQSIEPNAPCLTSEEVKKLVGREGLGVTQSPILNLVYYNREGLLSAWAETEDHWCDPGLSTVLACLHRIKGDFRSTYIQANIHKTFQYVS